MLMIEIQMMKFAYNKMHNRAYNRVHNRVHNRAYNKAYNRVYNNSVQEFAYIPKAIKPCLVKLLYQHTNIDKTLLRKALYQYQPSLIQTELLHRH